MLAAATARTIVEATVSRHLPGSDSKTLSFGTACGALTTACGAFTNLGSHLLRTKWGQPLARRLLCCHMQAVRQRLYVEVNEEVK